MATTQGNKPSGGYRHSREEGPPGGSNDDSEGLPPCSGGSAEALLIGVNVDGLQRLGKRESQSSSCCSRRGYLSASIWSRGCALLCAAVGGDYGSGEVKPVHCRSCTGACQLGLRIFGDIPSLCSGSLQRTLA